MTKRLLIPAAIVVVAVAALIALSSFGIPGASPVNATAEPPPVAAEPIASPADLALLDDYGCTTCHTTDGTDGQARTFQGLFGTRREMSDGSVVVADEPYIRESILEPSKRIAEDAGTEMPEIEIPPEDLEKMIRAIKSLR